MQNSVCPGVADEQGRLLVTHVLVPWRADGGSPVGRIRSTTADAGGTRSREPSQGLPWSAAPGVAGGAPRGDKPAVPSSQGLPWSVAPGVAGGAPRGDKPAVPSSWGLPWRVAPGVAGGAPWGVVKHADSSSRGLPRRVTPGVAGGANAADIPAEKHFATRDSCHERSQHRAARQSAGNEDGGRAGRERCGLAELCQRWQQLPAYTANITADRTLYKVACDSILLFDSGANVSVMKNIDMFGALDLEGGADGEERNVQGINSGSLRLRPGGWLRGPLAQVRAYYCPQATANILCQADVLDHFWLTFADQGMSTERYVLTPKSGGRPLLFYRNSEKLYVYQVPDVQGCDAKRSSRRAMHTTLSQSLQLLGINKEAITRALKVEALHRAHSYLSLQNLYLLVKHYGLDGVNEVTAKDVYIYSKYIHKETCTGCALGKLVQQDAVAGEQEPPRRVGELVHGDLFYITTRNKDSKGAPVQLKFLLTVDGYSGYVTIVQVKDRGRSEVLGALKEVNTQYRAQGHVIQNFRLDGEASFVAAERILADLEMINTQFCTPNRHVRVAEAVIRQVKALFRATLFGLPYVLPVRFYADLVKYLPASINLAYKRHNDFVTAHEAFFGARPDVGQLLNHEFGALVAGYSTARNRDDMPTGNVGIVVGRSPRAAGSVIVFDLLSRNEFTRREVHPLLWNKVFLHALYSNGPDEGIQEVKFHFHRDAGELTAHTELRDTAEEEQFVREWEQQLNRYVAEHEQFAVQLERLQPLMPRDDADVLSDETPAEPSAEASHEPTTELTPRADHEGAPLAVDAGASPTEHEGVMSSAADGDSAPLTEVELDAMLEATELPADNHEPAAAVPHERPPRPQRERRQRPERFRSVAAYMECIFNMSIRESEDKFGTEATAESVMRELNSLCREENPVWKFMTDDDMDKLASHIGARVNVLPSSLFLKDKRFADGSFDKLKSRLVCCGNFQLIMDAFGQAGTASSPTVNLTVVFIVLSLCAKMGLRRKQFDITSAFLHAELDSPEYMRLSRQITQIVTNHDPSKAKYVQRDGTMIVKLLRALYGLKSASLSWYSLLASKLQAHGYVRSTMDSCLFAKHVDGEVCYILVYVDDMLVCSSSEALETEVEQVLVKEFHGVTSREGDNLSFLGMSLLGQPNGDVKVVQSGYIDEVAKDAGVTATETRMPASGTFKNNPCSPPCDINEFRSLLMKVMFLALRTRPDVLVHTVVLSSRQAVATEADMAKLVRLVEYLHSTKTDGIIFKSSGKIEINAYVDAAFDVHADHKSHTGYVIFPDFAGSAGVLCRSMKQKTISQSSTEAEIIALHEGVRHLMWVLEIYAELRHFPDCAVKVFQDNRAAVLLTKEAPVNYKGNSKFISRKFFTVHEHLRDGKIELVHIGTNDMVADFFTKATCGNKYRDFRVKVMGMGDASEP
jgi:hypothetical protein